MTKITHFFSLNTVQIRHDPKFMKQFTVRIQSKINKILIVQIQPNPSPSNAHLCGAVFNILGSSRSRSWSQRYVWAAVLNIIRFPDRDPIRFCNSEPDPGRTGFP